MPFCKFAKVSSEFRKYHTHPLNIFLHLVTTPLGIFGLLSLFDFNTAVNIVGLHVSSLALILPFTLWLTYFGMLGSMVFLAQFLNATIFQSYVMMVVSYLVQELAHLICGEATFQSSYSTLAFRRWLAKFFEHTYLLGPLVLEPLFEDGGAILVVETFLSHFINSNDVLKTHLNEDDLKDCAAVAAWIKDQNLDKTVTTHWWYKDVPENVQTHFKKIAKSEALRSMWATRFCPKIWEVKVLHGMNEVYVSTMQHSDNSDTVFYTDHIDGPYGWFPFAAVFRCMVGLNENVKIRTCFPMAPEAHVITVGDVCAFDFSREIHRIEHTEQDATELRLNLKVHYSVYPRVLRYFGRVLGTWTVAYDIYARGLFLRTLRPVTLWEKILQKWIMVCTHATVFVTSAVGGHNAVYLMVMALLGWLIDYRIFLVSTSFVHYFIYMATYYFRSNISYYLFQRDAILYISVAMAQLAWHYCSNFSLDIMSLLLMVAGFGLSALATKVLGRDRTYFGWELGVWKASANSGGERITNVFPYSHVPHPMIVGKVIALLGMYKLEEFRVAMPYLVPVHILLYLMHMLQEEKDIWRRPSSKFESVTVNQHTDQIKCIKSE